ncbi:MAG: nucleotidyltransferase domain-containing protein [Zetaproteobacteria bacterium]|nr:nucleotidyltransferase domain-containing protein [Zetaproteobacteria bacterium]
MEEARRLVLSYLKPWKVEVYLFGSYARGDASKVSDIDLALMPKEEVPVDWLSGLHEYLDDSLITCEVDLIDLRQASERLKAKVQKEGVLWRD